MDKPPKYQAFLAAIEELPHIGRAAKAANEHRSAHYKRLETDPVYVAEFAKAWQRGVGIIRDAAVKRAVLGYQEPVIYKGEYQYIGKGKEKKLVTVTKYPERLMMKVLSAELPETYNTSRMEHSGPNGGPIQKNLVVEFVSPKSE